MWLPGRCSCGWIRCLVVSGVSGRVVGGRPSWSFTINSRVSSSMRVSLGVKRRSRVGVPGKAGSKSRFDSDDRLGLNARRSGRLSGGKAGGPDGAWRPNNTEVVCPNPGTLGVWG
ncbi:hypothetical protein B0H66DRAFT_569884 [Apodospora peruviana]|uniref:Secreted protein n=1 Tax=Apodospora peruviana TaxID=516989 RepID=A0AAE0LZC8_9PEZI|nr:hypothetical protein B0H66DRAFT_569884 [Apodospora peruviana]